VPMSDSATARNIAAELSAFGLENIAFVERPLPSLGPSQIRVRVRVASLNHRDLLIVQGRFREPPMLPRVPLSDGAGEVIEVGCDARRFKVGERVVTTIMPDWLNGPYTPAMMANALGGGTDGVLCKYFSADEHAFIAIPEGFSLEQAAALPCAGLAAWNALFEHGNLKPRQTVLIQGSGGVSCFALLFASRSGARVIAISSSDSKCERLRQLGAAHAINYKQHLDWSAQVLELTDGVGVDHVVETGGAGTLDQSIKSAAVGGTISVIGMLTGAYGMFDAFPILRKTLRLQGIVGGSMEMFERMCAMIEALGIHPVIDRTFSMCDVDAALRYLESGQHVGKILIRIDGA